MLPNVTAQGCAGFTYYPPGYIAAGDRGTCCFRSNTANKPADPLSPVECYEKDGGPPSQHAECSGQPLGVMLTGPSLSYAFPAANPTIRLVEFSSADLSLLDMSTYTADLHAANIEKKVEWELEYSFVKTFGLNASGGGRGGMSPAALAGLVERMAQPDSAEWELYRGKENGTLFCRGWLADDGKADSHCEQPCTGSCKTSWLNVMNGTGANTPPTRQPHSKAAASMLMLHHPPPLPLPPLLPLPPAAAAAARMTRTAPVLTPHTFAVNGSTVRCNSSWGHATTHAAQPENTRSVTFWGAWLEPACSSSSSSSSSRTNSGGNSTDGRGVGWGYTRPHPFSTRNAAAVLDAFYPSCDGASDCDGPDYFRRANTKLPYLQLVSSLLCAPASPCAF